MSGDTSDISEEKMEKVAKSFQYYKERKEDDRRYCSGCSYPMLELTTEDEYYEEVVPKMLKKAVAETDYHYCPVCGSFSPIQSTEPDDYDNHEPGHWSRLGGAKSWLSSEDS